MLRIIDERGRQPPRLCNEGALDRELRALMGARDEPETRAAFRRPRPRWTVEALDRQGRVMWRAHCDGYRHLLRLATELRLQDGSAPPPTSAVADGKRLRRMGADGDDDRRG